MVDGWALDFAVVGGTIGVAAILIAGACLIFAWLAS
jgi:hypothetical protein